MSPEMSLYIDQILTVCVFIFGFICIIQHKKWGKEATEFQYNFFKIRFPVRLQQVMFFIGGVIFMVFGVLAFFGII